MLFIVLALEILFYSIFMKLSKNEGNIIGYIITFLLGTVAMYLLDSNKLLAYLVFFLISLIGMRLFARAKVYNCDVLVLYVMCMIKLGIELILTFGLYALIKDVYIVATIVGVIKLGILALLNTKLNTLYNDISTIWTNNNFYIRYFASILIMIYIVETCILLIVQLI